MQEAPPSRSLPKSSWGLRGMFLLSWFPLRVGGRFLEAWLRSRRLAEPPRPLERGISPLRRRPKDGARLAALRSPFGNLRPIPPRIIWYPTLAGRGGSVSRRDHNRAYRRPHPTLRRNQASKNVPSQTPAALREGARGRGFSQRSRLPRIPPRHPSNFANSTTSW